MPLKPEVLVYLGKSESMIDIVEIPTANALFFLFLFFFVFLLGQPLQKPKGPSLLIGLG